MSTPVNTARLILSRLSIVTIGRLGGAATGLVIQVYLARTLSAEALGGFFLASSLAMFLAVAATCGLPLVTTRFVVRYRRRAGGDYSGMFLAFARRATLAASLALMVAAAALILSLPQLPLEERAAYLIGCLAVPGFALARLSGAAATAYRRFLLSYLPDLAVRPALFLAAVVAAGTFLPRLDLWLVVAMLVVLVTAQAGYQDMALNRIVRRDVRPSRGLSRLSGLWLKAALPLTSVALVTATFADLAILASGFFLDRADLAVFGVCVKVTLVAGFVQMTAHKMLQPDLAEALIASDQRRLSQTIAQAILIGVGVGLATLLAVAGAGDLVLSAFGEDFVAGRGILRAMLVGQTVVAAAGPAIQVLTLTRGQASAAWASAAAVVCLLAANALLIPLLGLLGAAVALVFAQVAWSVLLAVQVRRTTGIACDVLALAGPPRRSLQMPVSS